MSDRKNGKIDIINQEEKMNKKIAVYIASPYTKGDVAVNVRESLLVADKLAAAGFEFYSPLLTHFHHFLSPHPYEFWIEHDKYWIPKCDVLLRLPGESSGADAEVEIARQYGMMVYFDVDDLIRIKPFASRIVGE